MQKGYYFNLRQLNDLSKKKKKTVICLHLKKRAFSKHAYMEPIHRYLPSTKLRHESYTKFMFCCILFFFSSTHNSPYVAYFPFLPNHLLPH